MPPLTAGPVSFAGLGFLTFYLMGKMHIFDQRGHAVSDLHHIRGSQDTDNIYAIAQGMASSRTTIRRCSRSHLAHDGQSTFVHPLSQVQRSAPCSSLDLQTIGKMCSSARHLASSSPTFVIDNTTHLSPPSTRIKLLLRAQMTLWIRLYFRLMDTLLRLTISMRMPLKVWRAVRRHVRHEQMNHGGRVHNRVGMKYWCHLVVDTYKTILQCSPLMKCLDRASTHELVNRHFS